MLLRAIAVSVVICVAGVLAPVGGARSAQRAPQRQVVTVQLRPVGHSRVHGTARLRAAGAGTAVTLRVRGLPHRVVAYSSLQAGACADLAHIGASFAILPTLHAGRKGRAIATGHVRFPIQGAESVPLSALTTGAHVIVIFLPARLVACGDVG